MDEKQTGPDSNPAVQPNVNGEGQSEDSGRVDADASTEAGDVAEATTDDVVASSGADAESAEPEAVEEPAAEEDAEAKEEAE